MQHDLYLMTHPFKSYQSETKSVTPQKGAVWSGYILYQVYQEMREQMTIVLNGRKMVRIAATTQPFMSGSKHLKFTEQSLVNKYCSIC